MNLSWEDAINEFTIYMKLERGFSSQTISSYISDIDIFVSFLKTNGFEALPSDFSQEIIQQFFYIDV